MFRMFSESLWTGHQSFVYTNVVLPPNQAMFITLIFRFILCIKGDK